MRTGAQFTNEINVQEVFVAEHDHAWETHHNVTTGGFTFTVDHCTDCRGVRARQTDTETGEVVFEEVA